MACLLLIGGCDALQGQALKVWMASNENLQIEDGSVPYQAHDARVGLRAVAQDLELPWAMAFINRDEFLVTEKTGRLTRINVHTGAGTAITNLPEVAFRGQGGLLGVALHPQFANNRLLFLSYSVSLPDSTYSTRLLRARLAGNELQDLRILFTAEPALNTSKHFGGALVFDTAGHLYLSVGDRGRRHEAQNLNTHLGKIIRLDADGKVPDTNPLLGQAQARPEIFSWGHRNPQGLAIHPLNGELWAAEHGPQGGDEINLIRAGANYGWPVITYGEEYGGGAIGEGVAKAGMEQPIHYYVPSIGTAGIGFYSGDQIPQWRNNLFVTGLVYTRAHVSRLALADHTVVDDELLFEDLNMRMRNVASDPGGTLYILSENGIIFAVEPAAVEPAG